MDDVHSRRPAPAPLLQPTHPPIDCQCFEMFRHYATTPHSELKEAPPSVCSLTLAHAFFVPFPKPITMLDGGEMEDESDGDLTGSGDQESGVRRTLGLGAAGRQRVRSPRVRRAVTMVGPSGQRMVRFRWTRTRLSWPGRALP